MLKFWPIKPAGRPQGADPGDRRQRLVLHIGPHKTGTTSLQHALLKQYGSRRPRRIWYPLPSASGPGHAAIARALLGRQTPLPQPTVLELLEQARGRDCELVVLSSEDFSFAYPSQMDSFSSQLTDATSQVVVTLSPIGRRAVSMWQERVKHQRPERLEDAGDLILKSSLLSADLVPSFAKAFPKARISVIVANRREPAALFRFFTEATGIPLSRPRRSAEQLANQSLGAIEAEVLRAFNAGIAGTGMPDRKYQQARRMLRSLFASEAWKAAVPSLPLQPPEAWAGQLRSRCGQTIASLRELAAAGRIMVFGELDSLDDLTSPKEPLESEEMGGEDDRELAMASTERNDQQENGDG